MIFLRKRRRLRINDCRGIFLMILANFCALPPPSHAKFRICGFRLTMTMTALCKNQLCGGYFVPTKKRSVASLPTSFLPSTSFEQNFQENSYERRRRREGGEDIDELPWAAHANALKVTKRHNMEHGQLYGKRSGIASECCEKRCSLAYLRTYCCSSFQVGEDSGRVASDANSFSYSAKAPQPPNTLAEPQGQAAQTSMIGALAKLGATSGRNANVRVSPMMPKPVLEEAAEEPQSPKSFLLKDDETSLSDDSVAENGSASIDQMEEDDD